MLASPDFIPLVVKLGQREHFRVFKVGSHLIRGYADLGQEEFIMTGPGRLISLYTGTASNLPDGHEHFFSRVPSIDDITDVILRQNFDIKHVEYIDQRTWHVTAVHIETKKSFCAQHVEFECAMALLLLAILDQV